jgi:predicted SPOUT superfamily RNA methylase MTH1
MILSAFKQKAYNSHAGHVSRYVEGEMDLTAKVSVAIPASVVSDTPHLREKTSKIGLIARAAAIFRIDEIIVYPDNPNVNQERDADLIATLLTYVDTPQYLRKRLFKLEPELQYAGILPPLRTPHHPLNRRMKDLKIGEYREGATVSKTNEGTLVDIGVENPAMLLSKQLPLAQRVTVKVKKVAERVDVELVDRNTVSEYWGYLVRVGGQPFGKLVKTRGLDLIVATSKVGVPFASVANEIAERWRKAETVLVAFGAPSQGLHEIAKKEDLSLDDIADFVVNTIPRQGTETVRTEEALIASLAIFNERFRV